jgi:hypothetical protein
MFNVKSFGYLLMTREININDLADEILEKAKTDPDELTAA